MDLSVKVTQTTNGYTEIRYKKVASPGRIDSDGRNVYDKRVSFLKEETV